MSNVCVANWPASVIRRRMKYAAPAITISDDQFNAWNRLNATKPWCGNAITLKPSTCAS